MSQDITALLEDWLHEPDRLPAPRLTDVQRLVRGIPQRRGRLPEPDLGSLRPLVHVTRFALAVGVVALFGGFLLIAGPSDRVELGGPGDASEGALVAGDQSPSPVPAEQPGVLHLAPGSMVYVGAWGFEIPTTGWAIDDSLGMNSPFGSAGWEVIQKVPLVERTWVGQDQVQAIDP